MLSTGSRIGTNRIVKWIREGACGQSYQGEQTEGEGRGKNRFVKLIVREVSERNGFEDFFVQECQAVEQLQGRGIWPLLKFGVMKWKHWVSYDWLDGHEIEIDSPDGEVQNVQTLITLEEWMLSRPSAIGPDELLSVMTDLHCGLDRAHRWGVIHGNLKPSNVLVQKKETEFEGWVTEFGLAKLLTYRAPGEEKETVSYISQNSQSQDSHVATAHFRPDDVHWSDQPEESWDLQGLGKLVLWVIEKSGLDAKVWQDWHSWAELSVNGQFSSIPHSMKEIPGMADLADFGIKVDGEEEGQSEDLDALREKREKAWELEQKVSSLRFKRGMTALIGGVCLFAFLVSKTYLFFSPSPWTEYYLDGASDRYQLGAGVWSGQAWGIVPANYDDEGNGGQDVVGTWEREDGLLKLSFRKFKKLDQEEDGKKLWQFIGSGATSPEDYHQWADYLAYDQSTASLRLVKRVDSYETYVPGIKGGGNPRLYPEVRLRRSGGIIKPAELSFHRLDAGQSSWTVFLGVGFLLACFIYHRELGRLPSPSEGKD
jgi:serine/threonine protein kinase